MATEKLTWVHLTTKHGSSVIYEPLSVAQHAANGTSAAEQYPGLAHDTSRFILKRTFFEKI